MIFAGDAAYTQETLDKEIIGGFHLDPVKSIEAIRRIKEMARRHDAEIFVSHEMEAWDRWKHAPEHYGS
jgi:4-pyridoxolactonase